MPEGAALLERVISLLVATSWIYWLAACWMVRSFFRDRAVDAGAPAMPPVSILKPVRGLDPEAYENFESFCRQDYPEFEILFGVMDPADPAVAVIRRLQRAHPETRIRLVVAHSSSPNRKAGILHRLAAEARHDILAVSDSDMRVTPEYLRRVVAPLTDDRVGLVTCPYVGGAAASLPAGLEALHMGVTFLPSVIVARKLVGLDFALGASVVIRRRELTRIGGFAALADYLAEDYQLGARVGALGLRVHLSDYITVSVLGGTTFWEQWHREVRWARCTRVSRPREYPGLLLSFSTPLSGLLILAAGLTPAHQQTLAVSLVLRWVCGWLVTGSTGDRVARRWLPWLPVRDVLTALVWVAGGVGKRVVWRGEAYELEAGGKMRSLGEIADHAGIRHPYEKGAGGPPGPATPGGGEVTPGGPESDGEEAGRPPTPVLPHT